MEPAIQRTDEALVQVALAGNREAFAELYSRHFNAVYDFLYRMVRDRDEAADVTQETFLKAMEALPKLRQGASFKGWLFSIARNTALNRLERSSRKADWPGGDDGGEDSPVFEQMDTDRLANPEAALADRELADMVWEAASSLDRKQYALLDLHLRQGLDSGEIAEAIGVSKGNAYTMLSRLKNALEESVVALLLARRGRRDCPELDLLLQQMTAGSLTPGARKTIDDHLSRCPRCQETRKKLVSPVEIFGAFAAVPAPLGLRDSIWQSISHAWLAGGPAAAGDGGGTGSVDSGDHGSGASQGSSPGDSPSSGEGDSGSSRPADSSSASGADSGPAGTVYEGGATPAHIGHFFRPIGPAAAKKAALLAGSLAVAGMGLWVGLGLVGGQGGGSSPTPAGNIIGSSPTAVVVAPVITPTPTIAPLSPSPTKSRTLATLAGPVTPVTATSTLTPAATSAAESTSTSTPEPPATENPPAPTATEPAEAIAAPTSTSTPVPPTNTPIPYSSPTAASSTSPSTSTSTATPTSTSTPTPPTVTPTWPPTWTPTPSPTPTSTPSPSPTWTSVPQWKPYLGVSASSLQFDQGVDVSRFTIENRGGGVLDWSLSSSDSWLYATPPSGSLPAGGVDVVKVSISRAGLKPGTYTSILSISSNGGGATVQVIVFN